jgi:hypothetical protein
MQTYEIPRNDGKYQAFQIRNAYVSCRKVAAILGRVRDVTDIRLRKPFSDSGEVLVRFIFKGRECVVWEPFGDNSRYWIGPQDGAESDLDLSDLKAAFEQYKLSTAARITGDLLSLDFKSLLRLR